MPCLPCVGGVTMMRPPAPFLNRCDATRLLSNRQAAGGVTLRYQRPSSVRYEMPEAPRGAGYAQQATSVAQHNSREQAPWTLVTAAWPPAYA